MSKSTLFLAAVSLLLACGAPPTTTDAGAGGGSGGSGGGSAGGGSGGGTGDGGVLSVAPTVTSNFPLASATGVAINAKVAATFSTAMAQASLTATTFTLKQGTTAIPGAISYAGTTATFTPTVNLTANTAYTATIAVGAQSAAGLFLAVPFTWGFTTGSTASVGPAPVGLGTAGNFAILAKTAISTVPGSTITGSIALSPAAASFLTGFSLVADATNVFSTSTQVVGGGKCYAADYAVPTPTNLTTAVSNMEAAYDDAANRPTPDFLEKGAGNIGGLTLAPGLYKWTSTISIPANVTLSGGANDVWIFQTTGDLTSATSTNITLAGGAQAKNIFWQVAGKVTLGATSHFEGIILCKTEITLVTGATMNGRALAQTQVALQAATITQP